MSQRVRPKFERASRKYTPAMGASEPASRSSTQQQRTEISISDIDEVKENSEADGREAKRPKHTPRNEHTDSELITSREGWYVTRAGTRKLQHSRPRKPLREVMNQVPDDRASTAFTFNLPARFCGPSAPSSSSTPTIHPQESARTSPAAAFRPHSANQYSPTNDGCHSPTALAFETLTLTSTPSAIAVSFPQTLHDPLADMTAIQPALPWGIDEQTRIEPPHFESQNQHATGRLPYDDSAMTFSDLDLLDLTEMPANKSKLPLTSAKARPVTQAATKLRTSKLTTKPAPLAKRSARSSTTFASKSQHRSVRQGVDAMQDDQLASLMNTKMELGTSSTVNSPQSDTSSVTAEPPDSADDHCHASHTQQHDIHEVDDRDGFASDEDTQPGDTRPRSKSNTSGKVHYTRSSVLHSNAQVALDNLSKIKTSSSKLSKKKRQQGISAGNSKGRGGRGLRSSLSRSHSTTIAAPLLVKTTSSNSSGSSSTAPLTDSSGSSGTTGAAAGGRLVRNARSAEQLRANIVEGTKTPKGMRATRDFVIRDTPVRVGEEVSLDDFAIGQ